jgi:hypothetical protein
MKTVPMTSQGILDFASDLHAAAARMDLEVTNSTVFGQSFIGPWEDYLSLKPWVDPPPRGLVSLVNDIRGPLHVINTTADYTRLARFNKRLQALWDDGTKRGQKWKEPRPDDTSPGASTAPSSTVGDLMIVLALVAAVALASRR